MKKILALFLISLIALSSCKNSEESSNSEEPVELVFYGLYDAEEIYTPLIQKFQLEHSNVSINYKKFSSEQDYYELILNELAEGEGPDIFLLGNTELYEQRGKIVPAPSELLETEVFRSYYADSVSEAIIWPDDLGAERIWSLPLYVDTLALIFNSTLIASPSSQWEELTRQVEELVEADKSFERFSQAGISMGRFDNIQRGFDVVLHLIAQANTAIFTEDYAAALVADNPDLVSAILFFTSFAEPNEGHYSWNEFLADPNSSEKELTPFARGKVAMIFGYSYTFQLVVDEINRLNSLNQETISIEELKVGYLPQTAEPIYFARFLSPVVSRTSEHPDEAWNFLAFLSEEENLSWYHQQTHKPSPSKTLLNEQKDEPIYGIFAEQAASSLHPKIIYEKKVKDLFTKAIADILDNKSPTEVLNILDNEIENLITNAQTQ